MAATQEESRVGRGEPKEKEEEGKEENHRVFCDPMDRLKKLLGGEGAPLPVSAPENFRHEGHVGWNPETGEFEMSRIPASWKKLFKAAGIRKRDLQDPETRKQVLQVVYGLTGATLDDEIPELRPVDAAVIANRRRATSAAPAPSATAAHPEEQPQPPPPPPVPSSRPVRKESLPSIPLNEPREEPTPFDDPQDQQKQSQPPGDDGWSFL